MLGVQVGKPAERLTDIEFRVYITFDAVGKVILSVRGDTNSKGVLDESNK